MIVVNNHVIYTLYLFICNFLSINFVKYGTTMAKKHVLNPTLGRIICFLPRH